MNKTFGEWLKEWLEVYKKPFVKPHTTENYKIYIRLHVPERLKKTPLDKLSALDVQKALNGVSGSRTRLGVYNVLNGSLTRAYLLGLTERDVAAQLIKPRHVRKVGEALTKEEINAFISAIAKSRLKNFYTFCLLTGCRRSEALGLQWNDIDRKNGRIHIRGTKTATSDRYLPLFPDLLALLDTIKVDGEKVFRHRADYVSRSFKKYCPQHKLHDLRHTFATRCLECGINIKVVQKWLGHSRLDTTANIYTHVNDDFIFTEAEKFRLT